MWQRHFGEDVYSTFTADQIRDYKQLAYELLPTALPEIFGEESESINYIRNPIVIDWLNARNQAQEDGHRFTIKYVNSDKTDILKNISSMMHVASEMAEYDFSALNMTDGGESLLDQMLKQALGSSYDDASTAELSDYEAVLYQFLIAKSESARENIVNPVNRDKETADGQLSSQTEQQSETVASADDVIYTDGNITIYGNTASTNSKSSHSLDDDDYVI